MALGRFLTNRCAESTMRSAYGRGYGVVTLTDCVGARQRDRLRLPDKEFLDEFGDAATEDRSRGF